MLHFPYYFDDSPLLMTHIIPPPALGVLPKAPRGLPLPQLVLIWMLTGMLHPQPLLTTQIPPLPPPLM